ncbi:MAG: HAD-IA family hydrolase [Acidobacteriia bacterium]|nr:HAD-IA family hydrolase [Terriglobia bacterium]
MPTRLHAIFFDAGNTLIYPRVEELAADLTERGYPASADDFLAAERAGKQKLDEWLWPQIRQGELPPTIDRYYWNEYLQALAARVGVPELDRVAVMEGVANGFREISLWSEVLPETPPFLEKLRARGYYLGVISNSDGTIEQQIGRVGLRRHFQTVIDSTVVGVEKPHPGIFRIALERAGVAPKEAMFVGDTNATDMGGAELAGLGGVLLDRVGAYPHAQGPRITLLSELETILRDL